MTEVFELAKLRYGEGPYSIQHKALGVRAVTMGKLLKIDKRRFEKEKRKAVRNISMGLVHTFNASTGEADAGESLVSLRPAWSTE